MAEMSERGGRSTHVVYRITHDLRYQEAPCFCPASRAHSILDTHATPPAATEEAR